MNQKNVFVFLVLFNLLITTHLIAQDVNLPGQIKFNDIEAVEVLIDAGANINQKSEDFGYTALMWACEFNYTEMGKMLIKRGADVNVTAKDGSTALVIAAGNAPELVEPLLLKGANIKAAPKDGIGLMNNAAFGILYKGFPIETVNILLEHGAEVDETDTSDDAIAGFTPLMFAVRDNHEELAKILIARGANVNARARNAKTPLVLARENGYAEMEKLLMANGAE